MEAVKPKLGVDNIIILAVAAGAIGSAIGSISADGKFGITDLPAVVKLTSELGVLAHLKVAELLPEAGDIDSEEMKRLETVFDQNLRLGDHPTLEAKIEAGFKAIVKAVEAIQYLIEIAKV